jgi:hypothetical protein
VTANGGELTPLTFSESVIVDNYRAAVGGALAAADSVADKVVTAAFAVATAYGAVITLVAPKDLQTPWQAAVPFVPLALAVGVALLTQSIGISVQPTDAVDAVRKNTINAIRWKRLLGGVSLVVLAIALVTAGWVVYSFYGPSAQTDEETPVAAELFLTPAGTSAIERVCGNADVTVVRGQVNGAEALTSPRVSLELTKAECPSGAGTVVLPQRMIAASKLI